MRQKPMLSFPDFDKKRILVVFSVDGQKFAIHNENIIVKDDQDNVILQDPCIRILSLWIIGNCSITSVLLKKAKKYGFPIFHLQSNFRIIGTWNVQTEGNFLLRYKQYHVNGKEIAKRLVFNKIHNQLMLLKEIRKKELVIKNAIQLLEQYEEKVENQEDYKEILGIEGIAGKVFFSAYFFEMDWKGRQPRAKTNPINVLMDIGYTFLFYWIENMLNLYGFDLYKGVYHQNFYQRKSLVCDLVEPFRCIIDRQLRKAYNLGQINESDFIIEKGKCVIKYEKTKEYTKWLMNCLVEQKTELYYYCRDYYRAFMQEKEINQYPFYEIVKPKNI